MRDAGDRILGAEITGTARRHARHRLLTDKELAAGTDALRTIAGDRADLLAEAAGLEIGCHSLDDSDWALHRTAADLLVAAGAGPPEDIGGWAVIGRRELTRPVAPALCTGPEP